MKIFQEGNRVRFQLMDRIQGKMLLDFSIPKEQYAELRVHIIENLEEFEVKE